jgi:hypothetical protein
VSVFVVAERLEVRRFLDGAFVSVAGTDQNDVISIGPDAGGVLVTINGVSEVRSLDGMKGVMVRGEAGDDQITIDKGLLIATRIDGGGGNDLIVGGGGRDSVRGEAGNDDIRGRGGSDQLDGGGGMNRIRGDEGNDHIGSIGETMGATVLEGGRGHDVLRGSFRNDKLIGGAGNDTLFAGDGRDTLLGGSGKDVLHSDDFLSRDTVDGGSGNDKANVDERDTVLRVERAKVIEPPEEGGGPFEPCFLTTAVVRWAGKADDCEELTSLRKFRDGYMRGLEEGPGMIRDYYENAPWVVEAIEREGRGGEEWPRVYAMVREAVSLIEAARNAEALEVYSAEYLRLKGQYLG